MNGNDCAQPNGCTNLENALHTFNVVYNPQTKQLEQLGQNLTNASNATKQTECDNGDTKVEAFRKHRKTISLSSTISSCSSEASSSVCFINDSNQTAKSDNHKNGFISFISKKVFPNNGWWLSRENGIDPMSSVSSSALIQHKRPDNLPSKCLNEDKKHQNEYKLMVQTAKQRDILNARTRLKKRQEQIKQEEQMYAASRVWMNEIIPAWSIQHKTNRTRALWWKGLPSNVRGKIWKLAIGNELSVTNNLYEICVNRANNRLHTSMRSLCGNSKTCHSRNSSLGSSIISDYGDHVNKVTTTKCQCNSESTIDQSNPSTCLNSNVQCDCQSDCSLSHDSGNIDQESSLELIRLDISRTFPHLGIFQDGGPYYDMLHELLAAYVCYRPDVGYVQGMSFLAAILILNMEQIDAFVGFANLINRPLLLAAFTLNQPQMNVYFNAFNELFKENMPALFEHFRKSLLTPDLYLLDWIYTIYAKAMPLDVACRVWDLYMRDGDSFIFQTALGILHLHRERLLKLDFLDGAQFLIHLPDDLSSEHLFSSIKSIKVNTSKRTFQQLVDTLSAAHLASS